MMERWLKEGADEQPYHAFAKVEDGKANGTEGKAS
jgi:hypothetical protein